MLTMKTSSHDELSTLMIHQGKGQIFVSSPQKPLYNKQNKLHYVLSGKQTNQNYVQDTIKQ